MRSILVVLLLLGLLLPAPSLAQSDIPVVYGVFFFSPTCPHCHQVMENDLPRMQQEFGDQFQLLFVDVTKPEGNVLFQSAYNTPSLGLTGLGVPTFVIGREVMVGSAEIPARAFDIIRDGLENGGILLPEIPGLHEAYAALLAGAKQSGIAQAESLSAGSDAAFDLADIIASVVLLMLVTSVAAVGVGLRSRMRFITENQLAWWAAFVTALLGVGIGLTLAVEAYLSPAVLLLALVEIVALGGVAYILWKRRASLKTSLPHWLLPVAAVGGLAVAVYLSYVEVTQSDAICGLVGECNLVQQSAYARLFGVLPVGIFGIFGYVVILALWLVASRRSQPYSPFARSLLLGASLFGVAFSIYLTLLELFVINAVCMWCVSSALVSMLILWLVAGTEWEAPATLQPQRTA